MTKQQKIIAAVTLSSLLLLYATGLLWPLVRFCLTSIGLLALLATCYFGFNLYLAHRRRDENAESSTNALPPLVGSSAVTLFAFASLGFIPTGSSNQPIQESPSVSQPKGLAETESAWATKTTNGDQRSTKISPTQPGANRAKPSSPGASASQQRKSTASTRGTQQSISKEEEERAAAELVGALLGAAVQQQQQQQNDPRYQRFQRSMQAASVCTRCAGAKNYRYVDGNGVLQVRTCPSCNGSGRSY